MRGGLTVGPTHHSKDFVFGTAATEAYELESKIASAPLVLLSAEVVQDTMKLGPDFAQWLKEDGPNRYFNQLPYASREYTSERQVGQVILEYPAERIAFVNQRLNNDKDGVLKKAQWFQMYFVSDI